jgi:hypothetical protein
MTLRFPPLLLRLTILAAAGWLAFVLAAPDGRAQDMCAGLSTDPTTPGFDEAMASICQAATSPSTGTSGFDQAFADAFQAVDQAIADVATATLGASPPPAQPAQAPAATQPPTAAEPPPPSTAATPAAAAAPKPQQVAPKPRANPDPVSQKPSHGSLSTATRGPSARHAPAASEPAPAVPVTPTVPSRPDPTQEAASPALPVVEKSPKALSVRPRLSAQREPPRAHLPKTSAVLASPSFRPAPNESEDLLRLLVVLLAACSAALAIMTAVRNERERRRMRAYRDRLHS